MSIKLSGMVSGLDTDAMVQELVSSYSKKTETYEKARTKLEWKQEAWKELNTKIYDLYSNTISNMRFSKAYNSKSTTTSDDSKVSVSASASAVKGTQTLKIKQLAASGYLTGAEVSGKSVTGSTKLGELTNPGISENTFITVKVGNGEEKKIDINPSMSIDDVVQKLKSNGVEANFDATNKRFFISSTSTGKDLDFTLGGNAAVLDTLGLSASAGAVKIDGADAEIELNGAAFTSSTNSLTINGLTLSLKETTAKTDANGNVSYDTIKLVTDTNVDEIYNNIKDFIKQYNELINEMDALYNADTAKGYEPLTDEEKEAMSDEEIEKWEKKIKDSLLRRDGTVNSVASAMKNVMQQTFTVNGKKMSLSSFGIKTGSYFTTKDNEKNALHIDGDTDDSTVSGNDDKLRAAIASDPEEVADFFSQLAKSLYSDLSDRMKSTTLSSAFTVYNDKQLTNELSDYDSKISKWEDYVSEQEEYWYSKFTAMEKALSELQSSSSALSGLLGS